MAPCSQKGSDWVGVGVGQDSASRALRDCRGDPQSGSLSFLAQVTEGDGWQGTGGPVAFSDTTSCHTACIS